MGNSKYNMIFLLWVSAKLEFNDTSRRNNRNRRKKKFSQTSGSLTRMLHLKVIVCLKIKIQTLFTYFMSFQTCMLFSKECKMRNFEECTHSSFHSDQQRDKKQVLFHLIFQNLFCFIFVLWIMFLSEFLRRYCLPCFLPTKRIFSSVLRCTSKWNG